MDMELGDDPIVCRLLKDGSKDPSDLGESLAATDTASEVERE